MNIIDEIFIMYSWVLISVTAFFGHHPHIAGDGFIITDKFKPFMQHFECTQLLSSCTPFHNPSDNSDMVPPLWAWESGKSTAA